ncbi:arylsulfatase A-like [Diadema antillarum]|uniref:arylsulfatase A-like n=1 Tax=Diadema antillarum TaxID=105358 RepID=UPI003A89DA74
MERKMFMKVFGTLIFLIGNFARIDGSHHLKWEGVIEDVLLATRQRQKPNVIIFLADDLGYGDLACYGHPTSQTPNIDSLAQSGMKFTQFYASPLCTPTRASLMTGRYQTRVGAYPVVFNPNSLGGLPLSEITIAELLEPRGYDTYMVGKWHLGVGREQEFLPTKQGFHRYYGLPFSNDQCPCPVCTYPDQPCVYADEKVDTCASNDVAPCAIFSDDDIYKQPMNPTTLTQEYTAKARQWISESAEKDNPFFLYYAFNHVHFPQFAGKDFTNSSRRGIFGDVLFELDAAVGDVMKAIQDAGQTENTLTFFLSDNGANLKEYTLGGSSGPLKCGKFSTYEGGMRVPFIAHWPGQIHPGPSAELGSILDLLPTIASIAGEEVPSVPLDGYDLSGVLFNNDESPREKLFYFGPAPSHEVGPLAVRFKQFKAHFFIDGPYQPAMGARECTPLYMPEELDLPLLFDLNSDPEESFNLNNATWAKEVLKEIRRMRRKFMAELTWAPSQTLASDPAVQPCCNPDCPPDDPNFPKCCPCVHKQDHFPL